MINIRFIVVDMSSRRSTSPFFKVDLSGNRSRSLRPAVNISVRITNSDRTVTKLMRDVSKKKASTKENVIMPELNTMINILEERSKIDFEDVRLTAFDFLAISSHASPNMLKAEDMNIADTVDVPSSRVLMKRLSR